MITITEDKVIKVRMGSAIVDMFDNNGERLPVEGNATIGKKPEAKKTVKQTGGK